SRPSSDTHFRCRAAIPTRANDPQLPDRSIRCPAPPRVITNPDAMARVFWSDPPSSIAARKFMTDRLQYGTTAKVLHWLIVALLAVQYPIGWLMPDLHRNMKPGAAMTFHVSFGIVIFLLIVVRFAWRLTHPVAPESSLPPWQRLSSEAAHWLLYALVLATTVTGWLVASFRGWSMSLFYLMPLPMLASENAAAGKNIDGFHQAAEWALLVVIGIHVAAALVHILVYRDRIMQRMLPGARAFSSEVGTGSREENASKQKSR